MATVEELLWRIDATTEGLRRELKRADQSMDQSRRKLDGLLDRADRGFLGLRNVLVRSVLPAFASLASINAIRNMVADVGRLANTADKLGLTAERLQELRFAAEQNGVAAQTLDMAYQRFTRRLGEAQQGTGELLPVLEQYGIALRDVNGRLRSSGEVFGDLAEAIRGAGSSQEQLRVSFKAFDSEGAALVILMRQGRDGIQGFAQEAQNLGLVLSNELAEKARQFDDELNKLIGTIATKGKAAILDFVTTLRAAFDEDVPEFAWGDELEESRKRVDALRESLEVLQGVMGRAVTRRRGALRAQLGVEEAKDAALQLEHLYGRIAKAEERLSDGSIRPRRGQARRNDPVQALRQQIAAWRAEAERLEKLIAESSSPNEPEDALGTSVPPRTQAQIDAAKTAARQLENIERGLQSRLLNLRHDGADQIRAEYAQLIADIDALASKGAIDPGTLDRAKELAAAVRDEQLAQIKEAQAEAINKSVDATRMENAELEKLIDASRRGEEAIRTTNAEIEREAAVREFVNEAKRNGIALSDEQVRAYAAEVSRGAGLRDTLEDIGEASRRSSELARDFGSAYTSAMEDVIWNSKSATDAVRGLITEIAKIGVRKALLEPAGDAFGSFLPDLFQSFLPDLFPFERGGVMSSQGPVPLRAYASGGVANSPQMALFGEGSRPEAYVPLPDGRSIPVSLQGGMGGVAVNVRVYNNALGTEANADFRRDGNGQFTLDVIVEQVETKLARNVGRGEGMAPTLERRYGLNPAAGLYR